jgi:hypothetical protein
MFEFMTSDPRRPPPQSLQELKARGYELHLRSEIFGDAETIFKDKNLW